MKGKLIIIDGVDGCGKGTQINLLKDQFKNEFPKVIFSREPGGTPKGEEIRQYLLDHNRKGRTAKDDFDKFWESRIIHIRELIYPALLGGEIVIVDRFDSSTFAFQIRGEEHKELEEEFFQLRKEHILPLVPHYFFFDLKVEESLRRLEEDSENKSTYFDIKPAEYHKRVRKGFLEFGEFEKRTTYISAEKSVEDVFTELLYKIGKIL